MNSRMIAITRPGASVMIQWQHLDEPVEVHNLLRLVAEIATELLADKKYT